MLVKCCSTSTSVNSVKLTLFSEGGYFYLGGDLKRLPLQGTTHEEAVTSLAIRPAKSFPSPHLPNGGVQHREKSSKVSLRPRLPMIVTCVRK